MGARSVVVLGTASQAPTRTRNHVAVLLRLDALGVLVDPGEGTQRQMVQAGTPSSSVDRIAVTHAHGDHCLGLPGVLQRMVLDGRTGRVPLHAPATARDRLGLLTDFALAQGALEVDWQLAPPRHSALATDGPWTLEAAPLRHRVPTVGYRLVEADGRRVLPERLAATGVAGPEVSALQRGEAVRGVRLEDVSVPRPGQRVAVVMDTALCAGAELLAQDADLLVCEATFLHRDVALAQEHLHLTARQAGRLAREAGVRRLVLTHFSQRYAELDEHAAEAGEEHPDVVVARDLQVVEVPARRQ